MSKIGLLIEGGIDEEIVKPLVKKIVKDILQDRDAEPLFFIIPFPPNGYGEIPRNLEMLVRQYQDGGERARIGCDLFLIIHDSRKTGDIQRSIRRILRAAHDFPAVYGLAVQEIEAWVLGDIEAANERVFRVFPRPGLPTPPERDPDPKTTLTELFVRPSPDLEFDKWNKECARRVAPHLRDGQIRFHCPRGFGQLTEDLRGARRFLGE